MQSYLTAVAGAADAHGDSRVLQAGTTGTLVAAATGSTVQAGSAIVHTASDLRAFPELGQAFAAGRVSGQHVAVILATTEGLKQRGETVAAAVGLAAATDHPSVMRRARSRGFAGSLEPGPGVSR